LSSEATATLIDKYNDWIVNIHNREHPYATDVYVTGTFDNWSKSEKLDRKGEGFEKTVTLPDASEKIYYKVYNPSSVG